MPAIGGKRGIIYKWLRRTFAQVYKDSTADQPFEAAELRRQIEPIEVDITLVNKRLEESQGMCLASFIMMYREM